MRAENILGKKLLVVIAHPDDESFLAVGTLIKNRLAGGKSFVVCATLGERGKSHLPHEISPAELKQTRKQELLQVARLAKVTQLKILNLPDGEISKAVNQKRLAKVVLEIASPSKYDFLMSFDRDGISGHLDHIAAGEATRKVAQKLHIPFLSFCAPPKFQASELMRRRQHGVYTQIPKYPKPDFKVEIDPKLKLRALKLHRSQLVHGNPFYHFSKAAAEQCLHYEYFRINKN